MARLVQLSPRREWWLSYEPFSWYGESCQNNIYEFKHNASLYKLVYQNSAKHISHYSEAHEV